jgi:hypothetical protein
MSRRIRCLMLGSFVILSFPLIEQASESCDRAELRGEHKDAATLRRLERAWSVAFLKGDVELE